MFPPAGLRLSDHSGILAEMLSSETRCHSSESESKMLRCEDSGDATPEGRNMIARTMRGQWEALRSLHWLSMVRFQLRVVWMTR
jgi:hypothetical protein